MTPPRRQGAPCWRTPRRSTSVTATIRFERDILARIDAYATASRRSRNATANYLLDLALATQDDTTRTAAPERSR